MLPEIIQLTEEQLDRIINSAITGSFALGFFAGILALCVLIYFLPMIRQRNFKQWMLEKKDKDREEIMGKLESLYAAVDDLASMSNTQFFKSMHNNMCRLRSYLSQKWLQS